MGLWTRVLVLAVMALLAACKSRSSEQTGLKTVDFATADGTLVFMIAQDGSGSTGVFRYLCPNGRDDLPTREAVRTSCQLQQPKRFAGQDMIEMSVFDKDLTARYLESAGDGGGSMNTFELKLKGQLYKCLKTDAACDPLEKIAARNRVAAGHYQALLLGLMQLVLDGTQAESVRQEEGGAKTEPENFGLADDTGRTALAAAKSFKIPIFTQQVTVPITTLAGTSKVNTLAFELSQGCNARVSGIAMVMADGVQLVGPGSIIANTGNSFLIRKQPGGTDPLAVSQVQVVVRRSGIGPIRCDVSLVGWVVGPTPPTPPNPPPTPPTPPTPPNPPPTPPNSCTDAQRDRIMGAFTAAPNMRHWHYLWHGIRNSWDEMSASEQQQLVSQLGSHWRRIAADEAIGEEFLHMHEVMLAMIRSHLERNGCEMYKPWTAPPAVSDPIFRTFERNIPSGGFTQMQNWHQSALNDTQLRGMSLGRYGSWLEATLHNSWHMRHANPASASPAFDRLDLFDLPPSESDEVNLPSQDWLGHPYSSHVNPYFWRLHGYIDDRIFTWLKANNFQGLEGGGTVADHNRPCVASSSTRCYTWKRTWDGTAATQFGNVAASPREPMSDMHHHVLTDAEADAFRSMDASIRRLVNMNSNMFPVDESADSPASFGN